MPVFESTPDNVYEEVAPGRIYKYNPDAKLIFLVREPVSRAISEYNMACKYAIVENLCVREDPEREYFDYLKHPDEYPLNGLYRKNFEKWKKPAPACHQHSIIRILSVMVYIMTSWNDIFSISDRIRYWFWKVGI